MVARIMLLSSLLLVNITLAQTAFEMGQAASARTDFTEETWQSACADIIRKYMAEIDVYADSLIAKGLSSTKIRSIMEPFRTDLAKLESEATALKLQRLDKDEGSNVLKELKSFWSGLSARIDKKQQSKK